MPLHPANKQKASATTEVKKKTHTQAHTANETQAYTTLNKGFSLPCCFVGMHKRAHKKKHDRFLAQHKHINASLLNTRIINSPHQAVAAAGAAGVGAADALPSPCVGAPRPRPRPPERGRAARGGAVACAVTGAPPAAAPPGALFGGGGGASPPLAVGPRPPLPPRTPRGRLLCSTGGGGGFCAFCELVGPVAPSGVGCATAPPELLERRLLRLLLRGGALLGSSSCVAGVTTVAVATTASGCIVWGGYVWGGYVWGG